MTNPLITVEAIIGFLKNYPPEAQVMIDTNALDGGSFENLKPATDCESPLNHPRIVSLILTKYGS
jgi:hypothetical protein